MSEENKAVLGIIKDAMSNISDFDKGYFMGVAETAAEKSDYKDPEEESKEKGVN